MTGKRRVVSAYLSLVHGMSCPAIPIAFKLLLPRTILTATLLKLLSSTRQSVITKD